MPRPSFRFVQPLILALLLVILIGLTPAAHAATINVGPNTSDLITAMQQAHDGDVIELTPNNVYVLTSIADVEFGLPQIVGITLTIHGNGAAIVRSGAPGTPNFGIFGITFNSDVTISDLTVSNGSFGQGGAFQNLGRLTMTNVTLSDNQATIEGGAIENTGTVRLSNCHLTGNRSPHGGAIDSSGFLFVDKCTLDGNQSILGSGGAINANLGNVTRVTNSTIVNNQALSGLGGGLNLNGGAANLTNDTLTGNQAAYGAAVGIITGIINLNNSTVAFNTATQGGGGIAQLGGTVTVVSNIIIGNSAPFAPNLYGAFTSGGFNIIGDVDPTVVTPTQPTDQLNIPPFQVETDPNAPLADNGGPTQTIAIGANSVANGAGDCAGLLTDQRGVSRETPCDSGAFEFIGGSNGGGGGGGNNPPPQSGQSPSEGAGSFEDNLALCLGGIKDKFDQQIVKMAGNAGNVEENGVIGNTYCRPIVLDRQVITSLSEIGIPAIINGGVIDAINLWGMLPNGATVAPFVTPVSVCFQGVGDIIAVYAGDPNRSVQPLPVTIQGNYSCADVAASALIAMVNDLTGRTTDEAIHTAAQSLNDCQVTTTNAPLNLRADPNTTSAILDKLPYNRTLTATNYEPGWYEVIWTNIQGWVSSQYLRPSAGCPASNP